MTDNEQEQIYSIALTMVPGIGHIGAKRLVEGMKSATDVFRFRKELAQRLSGVHERVSGALDCPSIIARAEQELVFLQKNHIQCLTFHDEAYPSRLRECEDAPVVLFYKGNADLFVLPEMFSTGFCTKPEGVAESADSETLHWMQRKAVERNCAVAGSVAVQENGKYYNRFYFVHPDGSVQHYDKKHLFTYGGEDKRFTAGTQRVVVNYRGVRILLEVCYDLRFPVWSRNLGDYDMILYVASWPTPRVDAWSALLRARAIENQCYVAGVNRMGTDPACEYSGGSAIIDPYGKTMAECPWSCESEVTAEIDMEKLAAFREKFPVLNDADSFSLL